VGGGAGEGKNPQGKGVESHCALIEGVEVEALFIGEGKVNDGREGPLF